MNPSKSERQDAQDGAHDDGHERDDSTVIVAKWAGKCASCGVGFGRGDRIRWRRGHAAHLDCEAARAQLMARCDELIAAAGGRREDQR